MSAPRGVALVRLPPSLPLTERVCLGFGEPHTFGSTGPGHRRCEKCELKFRSLHFSPACEQPVHVASGTAIPHE